VLTSSPVGEWRTIKVKLSAFRDGGTKMSKIVEPMVLSTPGRLSLSLQSVHLDSTANGAIDLQAAE
jgi:beta-glucosidase